MQRAPLGLKISTAPHRGDQAGFPRWRFGLVVGLPPAWKTQRVPVIMSATPQPEQRIPTPREPAMRRPLLLLFLLTLGMVLTGWFSHAKDAPVPPREAPARMTVPDGFAVTLFAG